MKSLTLTQKFPIWTQIFWILMIFVTNLKKILPKLTKLVIIISKFEILNPKIQNLKSLTLKSKIFIFDKIWQKIKIPPRWFIITLLFHQNSMVKILKNLSQYGVTILTNFFQNFEVDTKMPKSPKLALITKILKKILKTMWPVSSFWILTLNFNYEYIIPRTHKICDIKNFFG